MNNKPNTSIIIRRSEERGHAQHGWLDSYHTFSFANYHDPAHMGFRSLRVINQDVIAAGQGFPSHPHRDMEIFSYVLKGALRHEDSMGNQRTLYPGEIQLMSAGTGVVHSEFNPSASEEASLLQIWIHPKKSGLEPSYTEWKPSSEDEKISKVLLISENGRENSATIHQDVAVYRLLLKAGESVTHELSAGRAFWLQNIAGEISLKDDVLHPGDAASSEESGTYEFSAKSDVEALLFDLA